MVDAHDLEALRAAMPVYLSLRLGVSDLTRAFRCPSPEHEDRTPSAHYYADKHVVHCFGCRRTWDVFQLVGMLEGAPGFLEQVRIVSELAGIRLDDSEGGPRRRGGASAFTVHRKRARPLFEPPREAGGADCSEECRRAYGRLFTPAGDVGRRYLHWRGFDDADIARFGLGFSARPSEIMPEFRWHEPDALGFVIIPFFDEGCETARYAMARTVSRGRVVNKEWRPKGLVSPLWREWMLTAGLPAVYVTEGLLDAMALEKQLERPVMALGGVSYAGRLASVLYHAPASARPGRIVVCMDQDAEGRRAAARIARDLDVIGIPHIDLPAYPGGAKDADEWLMTRRGAAWDFDEEPLGRPGVSPMVRTRWAARDGG